MWKTNESAAEFLRLNESYLLEKESINNMILGLVDAVSKSPQKYDDALFLTLEKDVPAQAMRINPKKPLVLGEISTEDVDTLISALQSQKIKLVGVIGPADIAPYFAEHWAKIEHAKSSVKIRLGIFELTTAIIPDLEGGEMHKATVADIEIVKTYTRGFIHDCFPDDPAPKERVDEMSRRHIQGGNLYLWKSDNRFVSMAAIVRESKNGNTISLVYTPDEERGKGFGKRIVAKVSERVLQSGKAKCNLFTDLSNPVSNLIYPKVGYKLIGKSVHYHFSQP